MMVLWSYLCAVCFFFFNDTATTEIYTLSLHDALPISFLPASERRSPRRFRLWRQTRRRLAPCARERAAELHECLTGGLRRSPRPHCPPPRPIGLPPRVARLSRPPVPARPAARTPGPPVGPP